MADGSHDPNAMPPGEPAQSVPLDREARGSSKAAGSELFDRGSLRIIDRALLDFAKSRIKGRQIGAAPEDFVQQAILYAMENIREEISARTWDVSRFDLLQFCKGAISSMVWSSSRSAFVRGAIPFDEEDHGGRSNIVDAAVMSSDMFEKLLAGFSSDPIASGILRILLLDPEASGEEMARELGCSASAISRARKRIENKGLAIGGGS